MSTYFSLLKKNGLKMWGTFLLGHVITNTVFFIFYLLWYLIGLIFVFGGLATMNVSSLSPEELESAMAPGAIIFAVIWFVILMLFSGFTSSFQVAGSYGMVNEAVLDGTTYFNTFFTAGFRYMFKLFGQFVLIMLLMIPISLPIIVLEVIFFLIGNTDLTPLALILEGLIGIIIYPLFFLAVLFAPIILTAENKGPWKSIKISFRLFIKSFGKVFVTALSMLAAFIPYGIFGFLMVLLFLPADGADESVMAGLILISILLYLLMLVSFPFFQAAAMIAASLRYKMYLRPMVVPEEYHNHNGFGDGNGGWNDSVSPQPEPIQPNPADQPYPEQSDRPEPQQPDQPQQAPEQPEQPQSPRYPQFPTDPSIK
ncbi:hypothetical protein [Paludifilum halophilum]|uniref:Glycerophosphoryl diester phosphodiesterase membrane domain-containing protein n=1 Tax=Paludifilum halophilum TaxID=1642702 RepID=A0A235B7P4_9BACL|nr:hypothetical protein [Paludifilum halophilum]OYD08333.1 hypothetical protein CHM34_05660 [Paludifilum halophilum]